MSYNYENLLKVLFEVARLGGPIDSIGLQTAYFGLDTSREQAVIVHLNEGSVPLYGRTPSDANEDIIIGALERELLQLGYVVQVSKKNGDFETTIMHKREVLAVCTSVNKLESMLHAWAGLFTQYSHREEGE